MKGSKWWVKPRCWEPKILTQVCLKKNYHEDLYQKESLGSLGQTPTKQPTLSPMDTGGRTLWNRGHCQPCQFTLLWLAYGEDPAATGKNLTGLSSWDGPCWHRSPTGQDLIIRVPAAWVTLVAWPLYLSLVPPEIHRSYECFSLNTVSKEPWLQCKWTDQANSQVLCRCRG